METETQLKNKYQVFGSENSSDYDVIVFVDEIPRNIDEAHTLCKSYNEQLSKLFTDKPLNANLSVVNGGIITDVFKGTPDEVNNALYYTYDHHTQHHLNMVYRPLERDIDQKVLRVFRCILSFFSRSYLRDQIKPALRGDLCMKIEIFKQLDFIKNKDFNNKKESVEDIYKVISFQYGQLFSLIDGFEKDSYTKNGIIKNYPELYNMLNRNNLDEKDMLTLNVFRDRLLKIAIDRIPEMDKLYE